MTGPRIVPVQPVVLGADGKPLVKTTVNHADPNAMQLYNATNEQKQMMAGRMLRDGASLEQIATEFAVQVGQLGVTRANLENWARRGLVMLEAAIARGEEPAESVQTVYREQWDVADEAMVDAAGVHDVTEDYLRGE